MLVKRDSFNRVELHRTTIQPGECKECGEQKAKFRYYYLTDGGRTITDKTPLSGIMCSGPFCSVSCFRSYNGA